MIEMVAAVHKQRSLVASARVQTVYDGVSNIADIEGSIRLNRGRGCSLTAVCRL